MPSFSHIGLLDKADINIYESQNIPANFTCIRDYKLLEPLDFKCLIDSLNQFPPIFSEVEQQKNIGL